MFSFDRLATQAVRGHNSTRGLSSRYGYSYHAEAKQAALAQDGKKEITNCVWIHYLLFQ
jgi:hypothetical protein